MSVLLGALLPPSTLIFRQAFLDGGGDEKGADLAEEFLLDVPTLREVPRGAQSQLAALTKLMTSSPLFSSESLASVPWCSVSCE